MKRWLLVPIVVMISIMTSNDVVAQNYALDFGGLTDHKRIMVGKDSRFDTDEITVEAWIKPTSLPTGTYITGGRSTIIWNGDQSSGNDPYIFYINEYGALEAHVDFDDGPPGIFIIDDTPVSLNEWQHVALVIDLTQIALFLNGYLVEEVSHQRGSVVKNHSRVAIGRHLLAEPRLNSFAGVMDEIRIWGTALSEEDIKDRMYAHLTGNEVKLVAYWKFSEGSGQWVYDSTPNEIHGVLGSSAAIEIDQDPLWVISDRPEAPPFKYVLIDIRPGDDDNCLNLNEYGVIPAAIFGSEDFDVYEIDIDTLSLQGLSVKMVGKANKLLAHFEDIDGDGYMDLIAQFEDTYAWTGTGEDYAILTGTLYDGTPIEGSDSICIVP
jgi:hypothetical protein